MPQGFGYFEFTNAVENANKGSRSRNGFIQFLYDRKTALLKGLFASLLLLIVIAAMTGLGIRRQCNDDSIQKGNLANYLIDVRLITYIYI